MTRLILAFLMVSVAGWPASPAQQAPPDLAGVYACTGTNPDGKPYRGMVQIVKHDDRFSVRWYISQDEQPAGIGIIVNGRLAVAIADGGRITIAVYSVSANKPLTLSGIWAATDMVGRGKETLTKLPPGHVQPPPVQPQQQPAQPQRGRQVEL